MAVNCGYRMSLPAVILLRGVARHNRKFMDNYSQRIEAEKDKFE